MIKDKLKSFIDNSVFIQQVIRSAVWVWQKPLRPFRVVLQWIYSTYVSMWKRFTRVDGEFSPKRGGIMVLSTAALIWMIPTLLMLSFQMTMYMATYTKERVYLFHATEIYPDDNIWTVRGCEMVNCATESLYFRVQPTLFNQLWSYTHKFGPFLADDVASGVPPGKTECEVISYGIRVKTFMRRFEIYPDAISVICDGERKPDQ